VSNAEAWRGRRKAEKSTQTLRQAQGRHECICYGCGLGPADLKGKVCASRDEISVEGAADGDCKTSEVKRSDEGAASSAPTAI
jgi:hypothetical protein